jgi:hypothetical protein
MDLNSLVQRVDQLLDLGTGVVATIHKGAYGLEWVDTGRIKGFRSAALSFIERVYGSQHSHYREFSASVDGSTPNHANAGIAILEAIRGEIAGGWLFSIKGLISAEIFSDFLEMADYLLSQDYKDPAAVIGGSVLEEHVRQLCLKNEIDVGIESGGKVRPKKADTLNSELAKAGVYSKLDQKAVTTWLDLRNKAAHGEYNEYTKDQVLNMLHGIIEFLSRMKI